MKKMVIVAWDKLPPELQAMFTATPAGESFKVRRNAGSDDQPSQVRCSVSGRGGSPNFLLVSEWGAIQFDQPKRSEEIKTGAMVAAEFGIRVIETTWKGADDGDVWPYIANALKLPEDKKGPKDWRLRFFPWWIEPKYSYQGDAATITPATWAYLRAKAAEISADLGEPFEFSTGQALFYQHQADTLGLFVKREFPTVLPECWEAPVEGAIYAEAFAAALADGRVVKDTYVPGLPVFTSWDLGGPENMVVWYFQVHDGRLWWIDCDMKLWLTTPARVAHMKAKCYTFAKHFIPHDAAQTQKGALTYENELIAAGLDGVVVVQRTTNEWLGINKVLQLFPNFCFDADKCATGAKSVKAFHVHEKTKEPVHDWSSHACDAIRTAAEAALHGLLDLDTLGLMNYNHLQYFDHDALAHYERRAVEWQPRLKVGAIEHGIWVERDDATAWLRRWEQPYPGQRYLLTAVPPRQAGEGWAIGVWRRLEQGQPLLVSAVNPGLALDNDRAAAWVAQLAELHGRCLIVPVVDESEGFVELLLQDRAANLWLREEPRENQPVGRGRVNRKAGFKLTPPARAQILTILRARVREHSLEAPCAHWLAQMRRFIEPRPGAPPEPAPGHGCAWVIMSALAAHCIGSATLFATPSQPAIDPRLRGHVPQSATPYAAGDVEG